MELQFEWQMRRVLYRCDGGPITEVDFSVLITEVAKQEYICKVTCDAIRDKAICGRGNDPLQAMFYAMETASLMIAKLESKGVWIWWSARGDRGALGTRVPVESP